jgi:hypothetical protein
MSERDTFEAMLKRAGVPFRRNDDEHAVYPGYEEDGNTVIEQPDGEWTVIDAQDGGLWGNGVMSGNCGPVLFRFDADGHLNHIGIWE